jgi:DNA-binding response OmpR family regulator
MTASRVLVVDDEPSIVDLVATTLRYEGHEVAIAATGRAALSTAAWFRPHLVLLDVMLPDIDGFAVHEGLDSVPVIYLTARDSSGDAVRGLTLGADDYVTKPFSPRELLARVKALLRRAEPPADSPRIIEIGKLAIDPASYRVSHSGKPVPLSTLEFRLLYYLASRPNRVFTRDQLLDAVWGTDRFVTPRSVDVYVRRLREKIESDPENPNHLKTVRGAGYLFETRAA